MIGLGVFTAGSAAAALAPGIGWLIAARAFQGVGAAILIPLTLTLLSAAVPPARRGLALGAWGAVGGLAIAIGPLVGGAVVEGASWQWIFWLNVPIGLALLPFAWTRLTESYGPATRLDLPGVALASLGLLGIVLGVVRGNDHGWTSLTVLAPIVIGALLVAGFVAWELRAPEPMLPMRLFRSRGFTMTNVASLLMFFGMFGSIFLLAQFLQVVQGYSPLQAGLRTLPWTAMPVLVAPIAGLLSDRIGGRPLLATGLALQAIGLGWLAAVISPTVAYATLVPAFVVSGIGMSLFFAPVANVVLGSVRRDQEGIASGANNAIRELGGVFGIAVLGAVFSARGGYTSGAAFVSGLSAAVWVGAAAVAAAAVAALFVPRLRMATAPAATAPARRQAQPAVAAVARRGRARRRARARRRTGPGQLATAPARGRPHHGAAPGAPICHSAGASHSPVMATSGSWRRRRAKRSASSCSRTVIGICASSGGSGPESVAPGTSAAASTATGTRSACAAAPSAAVSPSGSAAGSSTTSPSAAVSGTAPPCSSRSVSKPSASIRAPSRIFSAPSRAVIPHGPPPTMARLRAGTATSSMPGSAHTCRTAAAACATCPGDPSGDPSSWASRASTASAAV